MSGMQTENLLLILLSTGLLIVLVLTAANLWVFLTILFKVRRAMLKTKSAADKGLSVLKFFKPTYLVATLAAIGAALLPNKD